MIGIDERLRLRRWQDDDAPALQRHANDAEVERGLSQRFPHPYTAADAQAFLSGAVVDLAHAWAITLDGEAIGGIGLRPGEGERAIGAELGYWLGRAHWGQGLMTQVLTSFVPWAMREYGLQRMQASVLEFNAGSMRVLEKTGFVREGVLRQAVRKHGRSHALHLFARLRAD